MYHLSCLGCTKTRLKRHFQKRRTAKVPSLKNVEPPLQQHENRVKSKRNNAVLDAPMAERYVLHPRTECLTGRKSDFLRSHFFAEWGWGARAETFYATTKVGQKDEPFFLNGATVVGISEWRHGATLADISGWRGGATAPLYSRTFLNGARAQRRRDGRGHSPN